MLEGIDRPSNALRQGSYRSDAGSQLLDSLSILE